jgi:hypothetical protein
MRDVAKIGRAIGVAANRNRNGQCTLSTWQTRGRLGEGLGNHVTVSSKLFPDLNWMGRLWKLVRKKCPDNIYYETFEEFTSGINDCLRRVETDYQSELDTLMKLNFQKLKKSQLMTL